MKRTSIASLVVVAIALFAMAATASAKEPMFFGEFTASPTPATVTSKSGSVEFKVGAWEWSCPKIKSKGQMPTERSTHFLAVLKISGCEGVRKLSGGFEEHVKFKVQPGFAIEFRANGSGNVGEAAGELEIVKGSTLHVKSKGGVCEIVIPQQSMPTQAEKKPEHEYEVVEYFPEKEATTKVKTYPSGFKEKLEIDWESNHFLYEVPAGSAKACGTNKESGPEETVKLKGHFTGELDELQVKGGDFGFTTEKAEA